MCMYIIASRVDTKGKRVSNSSIYLPVKALFEVQSMFSTATVIINAYNISGSAPVALFTTV